MRHCRKQFLSLDTHPRESAEGSGVKAAFSDRIPMVAPKQIGEPCTMRLAMQDGPFFDSDME